MVVGRVVGTLAGETQETVEAELSLKGRKACLPKELWHELGHEPVLVMDHECSAMRLPRNDIRVSTFHGTVEDAMQHDGEGRVGTATSLLFQLGNVVLIVGHFRCMVMVRMLHDTLIVIVMMARFAVVVVLRIVLETGSASTGGPTRSWREVVIVVVTFSR